MTKLAEYNLKITFYRGIMCCMLKNKTYTLTLSCRNTFYSRRYFFILLIIILPMMISCSKQKPTLTVEKLSLTVPKSYNININNKIEGSSYYWWSDNESVAKVNSINGIVTAVGEGRTTVYCKITANGKEHILSCDVEVKEPMFFKNDYMAHASGGY